MASTGWAVSKIDTEPDLNRIGLQAIIRGQLLGQWSGRRDSNPRPSAPKADALPGCATPRLLLIVPERESGKTAREFLAALILLPYTWCMSRANR